MSKKDKDFYVWTMEECIKSTYEWWGIDMMSMYDHIKKDFPNATKAIHKMYEKLREPNFYESEFKVFDKIEYVYEALANLIPHHEELLFDIKTEAKSKKYKTLNICSWNRFVSIRRIDLLMAVLLFTEEFILQKVSAENVILTDNKLIVDEDFVGLDVLKDEYKTYVSIKIKNVILLQYVIIN